MPKRKGANGAGPSKKRQAPERQAAPANSGRSYYSATSRSQNSRRALALLDEVSSPPVCPQCDRRVVARVGPRSLEIVNDMVKVESMIAELQAKFAAQQAEVVGLRAEVVGLRERADASAVALNTARARRGVLSSTLWGIVGQLTHACQTAVIQQYILPVVMRQTALFSHPAYLWFTHAAVGLDRVMNNFEVPRRPRTHTSTSFNAWASNTS